MSVALPVGRRRSGAGLPSGGLAMGLSMLWLSLLVVLPLAAVVAHSLDGGIAEFWDSATSRQAVSALRFTLLISLATAAINAGFGTLIAWVLVRDRFPGKTLINAVIDLPFALPTIVAGLTLLALYGPGSPIGVNVALTKLAVLLALLFVTLPFVIRSVQPVLLELDREMEEAAASLGARPAVIFARVILPSLIPAILSGAALALQATAAGLGVERLALFEPPYTAGSEDDQANSDLAARIRTLVAEGRRGDAVEAFQLAIGLPLELVVEVRNAPFRPALEAIAHTLVYDLAVLGSGAVPVDVARKVDVPTLTVVGGTSPEPLQAAGRGVDAALPDGRIHVIDGAAHNIGPEQLAPVLRDFFIASR